MRLMSKRLAASTDAGSCRVWVKAPNIATIVPQIQEQPGNPGSSKRSDNAGRITVLYRSTTAVLALATRADVISRNVQTVKMALQESGSLGQIK
jgi:hypothetical protein